ncbi:unnamed protein product [Diamesa tonsa]
MDPATAVGFYTAIISVAETIKKYAIDDDGGMLQSLEDLKNITKLTQDTIYRISNQISSFSRELSGSTLQIINEYNLVLFLYSLKVKLIILLVLLQVQNPLLSVITGVRFLEKNHVIFLQIQVGKLLPYAIIDESTVQWMDVPQDIGSNYIEFGFDFRKFSLDGILMESQILTAIQFVQKDGSVRLQVNGQGLIDFEMGKMGPPWSFMKKYAWTDVKSIEGKLIGLRNHSTVYTKTTNQIIKFGVSDEKTDAGQSFVPYFDGTAIEFDNKTPLSGVGFMHFTNDDSYAGYIRPYIMSFRYKTVIN